jgi:hypothetical protein
MCWVVLENAEDTAEGEQGSSPGARKPLEKIEINSGRERLTVGDSAPGEVAERLNASVSKTDISARISRVRIPPSPLF